jgi:hypothetical protein
MVSRNRSRSWNILSMDTGALMYFVACSNLFIGFHTLHRNVTKCHNVQVSLGLEWFCTADVLSHKIQTTQNYILMPYQPYAFVMWHFLFSSLSWPKITYPSAGYEVGPSHCSLVLRQASATYATHAKCGTRNTFFNGTLGELKYSNYDVIKILNF